MPGDTVLGSLVPAPGELVDSMVAGQDVDLIDGTMLENIKWRACTASDEAIATALEIVGISELMESLPDGYNTWVALKVVPSY